MAENPFFNRVDERNGSVIMDISDTTATANDVLAGKKFYSASGAPSTGTLVPGTITEVQANGTRVATSGVANIPAASTSEYGVTKLNNTTSSTSTSEAATAAVAKQLKDKIGNVIGTDLQSQIDLANNNINKWGPFDGTSKNWASSGSLNNYKTPGVYAIGPGVTDVPSNTSAWGILEVLAVRQDTIEQKYCYGTHIFVREFRGTWSAWEELALISKITNSLRSGKNVIHNIIAAGYNTGSGNYFDFFVPCNTGGKTVTSASIAADSAIYLPTTRIGFSSDPEVTVIGQTNYGVRLEVKYPSTNTPNICGTIYAINVSLTCS